MIKIRLFRIGKKKKPFYRIVIADARTSRNGKIIENIGFYNPFIKSDIFVNCIRYNYWKKQGAQVNDTALNIIKKFEIINKNM